MKFRLSDLGTSFKEFYHSPAKVGLACLLVLFTSLVSGGQILQLWNLHNDFSELERRKGKLHSRVGELRQVLKNSENLEFLEKAAMESWDFADSNELVFIFSDESKVAPD